MNILGIETTTKFLCLGVYRAEDRRQCTLTLEAGTRHAELLSVFISRVLESSGTSLAEVGGIAVGVGPGSFTGIRVGVSAAKGLAWALDKPLIAVPTLDVIARNALYSEYGKETALAGGMIIPVVDAKRGLVYTCGYRMRKGTLARVMPYQLLAPDALRRKMKGAAALCGDGAGLYAGILTAGLKGAQLLDKDFWFPTADEFMRCARERSQEKRAGKGKEITPIYLYPQDCQVKPCAKRHQ